MTTTPAVPIATAIPISGRSKRRNIAIWTLASTATDA